MPVFKIETNGLKFRILIKIKKEDEWVEKRHLNRIFGDRGENYFSSYEEAEKFIRLGFGPSAETIRQ